MSNIVYEDPTPQIAERLRAERRRHNWSLEELARRAGVSKSMLSKVERGESSPTAALLGRISGALGITMSAFLVSGDQVNGRLSRRDEQPIWHDPETRYLRRQVSPRSDLRFELIEVELPPKTEVTFPASAYSRIRQVIWVLGGVLEFVEGSVVQKLEVGDCLELGTPARCIFRNPGRSLCRYLVVISAR